MIELSVKINIGKSKLLNLDTDEYGNYIAITNKNEVITKYKQLIVNEKFRFPIIRWLPDEKFLIAESRCQNVVNVFVYSNEGNKINSFFAGDGIEDILVLDDSIIVTYFDEGVMGSEGPNNDGLTIFNLKGNQLYGFNSGHNGYFITDCYAVCKLDNSRILFYPFTKFPIIELNIKTFKCIQYEGSEDFKGSHAMVTRHGEILFHGKYDDERSFYSYNISKRKSTYLGNYLAKQGLRGLENGKFLEITDDGFYIVNPIE